MPALPLSLFSRVLQEALVSTQGLKVFTPARIEYLTGTSKMY